MQSMTNTGGTLAKIGGLLLFLSIIVAIAAIASILGPLTPYAFSIPEVTIGIVIDIILGIILLVTRNGIVMLVTGVLGIIFPMLLVGGIVGMIGGMLGLIGGILTTITQFTPSPPPSQPPALPPPPPPPPPPLQTAQTPSCPTCGGPLTYIHLYQRWYCYHCAKYA